MDPDLSELLGEQIATNNTIIHESELSALLGITRQRVAALARSGILKRTNPARFDMHDSVKRYCANLREKAGRAGRPALADGDPLKMEKLRLAKEQADALELKNAAARGEMVKADIVEREWSSILRDLRAALLAVPSRVGSRLPSLTAHDIAEIDAEIRATLEVLADGN